VARVERTHSSLMFGALMIAATEVRRATRILSRILNWRSVVLSSLQSILGASVSDYGKGASQTQLALDRDGAG
jgi:hypothetical protein